MWNLIKYEAQVLIQFIENTSGKSKLTWLKQDKFISLTHTDLWIQVIQGRKSSIAPAPSVLCSTAPKLLSSTFQHGSWTSAT
jgi:hypothetical protein